MRHSRKDILEIGDGLAGLAPGLSWPFRRRRQRQPVRHFLTQPRRPLYETCLLGRSRQRFDQIPHNGLQLVDRLAHKRFHLVKRWDLGPRQFLRRLLPRP